MYLKAPTFLLALLLAFSQTYVSMAQSTLANTNGVTVTAGPVKSMYDDPDFKLFTDITDDSYTMQCKVEGENRTIRFNSSFEQVEVRPEPSEEQSREKYQHVFRFNGRSFLLEGTASETKKKNVFTQTEITSDGEPIGESVVLAEIEGEEFYSNPGNAKLYATESDDGSKLLVYLKLPEQRIGDGRLFTIYKYFVYNESMELLWSRVFEFKHEGGRVIHETYNITRHFENDGSVSAWAILDRGRKEEDRFAIRFYSISGDNIGTVDVELKQKMDRWKTRQANNRTYLFDTYGIEDGEGIRVVILDPKTKKGQLKYVPFGVEHLVKNQPEKIAEGLRKRAENGKPVFAEKFLFKDVIPTPNGDFVLTGQEGFDEVTEISKFSKMTEHFRMDYHLIGINGEAERVWSQIIPLDQRTGGDDHGCIVKSTKTKVYAIFSDSEDNYGPDADPMEKLKPYKGRKGVAGMVVIDTSNPNAPLQRVRLWDQAKEEETPVSATDFITSPTTSTGVARVPVGYGKERFIWLQFQP